MMVSGYLYYCAYYSKEDKINKNRMVRRIIDLVGVYLLFDLLHGSLKILTGAVSQNTLLNEIAFVDILLIPIKPLKGYWYLYTLIVFYVVFAIFQKKRINEWILLVPFFVLSSTSHYTGIEYFTVSEMMKYAFFFDIGLIYKKSGKWILENKLCVYFFFAASVMTLVILDFSIPQIFGVDTMVELGISMGIWLFFEEVKILSTRLFQFIGKISLEIYVMHGIVLAFLRNIIKKAGINQPWACVFFNFALTIMICILITVVLQKIKLHDLCFKPASSIRHKWGK